MHPHTHLFTCANVRTPVAVKLRGWEALSICLCSSVFYTLFCRALFSLSTFSLTHSVPFPPCLSVSFISHLFPHLPSFPLLPLHLLSSHILPYLHLLSLHFKARTDSVFCRCVVFYGIWVFSQRSWWHKARGRKGQKERPSSDLSQETTCLHTKDTGSMQLFFYSQEPFKPPGI